MASLHSKVLQYWLHILYGGIFLEKRTILLYIFSLLNYFRVGLYPLVFFFTFSDHQKSLKKTFKFSNKIHFDRFNGVN